MNPFGNTKPNESLFTAGSPLGVTPSSQNSSPFSSNPMFNKPMSSLSDMDIDQMMKDIDRRLKELDEEEERQKKEMEKANNIGKPTEQIIESPKEEVPIETLNIPSNIQETKIEELPKETKSEVKITPASPINKENKPKINVDADSIIVNDSGITDDEFFDDFFGEWA